MATGSRYTRVKAFGRTWFEALRQLWLDPSVATTTLAKRLGVKNSIVEREARQMGLPMSRPKHAPGSTSPKLTLRVPFDEKQRRFRQCWLDASQANPAATRSELRWHASSAYNWLRKHDKEWLEAHQPSLNSLTVPANIGRVNWAARDSELAPKVLLAAAQLLTRVGKPKRLTFLALAREIGNAGAIMKNKAKLPLTLNAMESLLETNEDFTIRRIHWAAEALRQEQGYVSRRKLSGKIWVSPQLLAMPSIRSVIQKALDPDCP